MLNNRDAHLQTHNVAYWDDCIVTARNSG